jgi:nicotinamide-nucleotide amidase
MTSSALRRRRSTTGVGGPGEEEGQAPGTVYIGMVVNGRATCERLRLDGSPAEVVERATEEALRLLLSALEE